MREEETTALQSIFGEQLRIRSIQASVPFQVFDFTIPFENLSGYGRYDRFQMFAHQS